MFGVPSVRLQTRRRRLESKPYTGAGAGAASGAALGLLAGPAAPIVVPVMATVGALVGGAGQVMLESDAEVSPSSSQSASSQHSQHPGKKAQAPPPTSDPGLSGRTGSGSMSGSSVSGHRGAGGGAGAGPSTAGMAPSLVVKAFKLAWWDKVSLRHRLPACPLHVRCGSVRRCEFLLTATQRC